MSKHSDNENDDFSLFDEFNSLSYVESDNSKHFSRQLRTYLPLRSSRYDVYNSRYQLSKFSYFSTLVDCTLRRLLPNDERSLTGSYLYGFQAYSLGGGGGGSRARAARFQTAISQKRLEITLSIRYENSLGAQALSIGKGYGALGSRISEKVGQNLIVALELQKWLETIVPLT